MYSFGATTIHMDTSLIFTGIPFLSLFFKETTNADLNARQREINDKITQRLISVLSIDEQAKIWKFINKLRDGDEISSDEIKEWNELEQGTLKSKVPAESDLDWLITVLSTEMMLLAPYFYNPTGDINHYLAFTPAKKDVIKYNVTLSSNEDCYLSGNINYLEEKTMSRQVTYGGVSTKFGSLRLGSISYSSSPNKGMSLIGLGRYFLTSKRIIFLNNKDRAVRQIKLSDIVSFEIFKDSILFHTPNNKKPMLLQMENDFSQRTAIGEYSFGFRYDHILIGLALRKLNGLK